MQKVSFLSFIGVLLICVTSAFLPAKDKLEWLTLKEANQKYAEIKKPVLIDLYTNWCGWCKVMDNKTYTNKDLIEYVETNFYPVKINAETKDSLVWQGRKYGFDKRYGANSFAVTVLQGQLAYPATVIIPADGSTPQFINGMMEVNEIEPILKYFGEGKFKKVPFDEFHREFKSSW